MRLLHSQTILRIPPCAALNPIRSSLTARENALLIECWDAVSRISIHLTSSETVSSDDRGAAIDG